MATLATQIDNLNQQVVGLRSLVNGVRDQGLWYAMLGNHCVFGCKITEGYSAADMILALEGNATGDSANLNPDASASPVRPEEYYNIANIYGEVFYKDNVNKTTLQDTALTVNTAPGVGYHRYDIVYGYVNTTGPALAIAEGTPVLNASTPTDPTIPQGAMRLARVHVQASVTAIANADITDLRDFSGRLTGAQGISAGLNYTFSNSVSGDPGSGKILVNNASYSLVTQINISETDAASASMIAVLDRWGSSTTATDKGVIRIVDVANRANFIELQLTAAPTDAGTYRTCPVTYLASNGTITNTSTVSVEFDRTGDKGSTGSQGISAGLNYTFSNSVTGDPGSGKILVNNTTYSLVTQVNISEIDAASASMIAVLDRWGSSTTATDKGVIRIVDVANRANFIELQLTAAPTDAGTYRTCPVTYLASNGTITNTSTVSVEFDRTGDKGADGLGAGTVTSVSVVTANGFAGTVATATTTPAITISTSVTGLLKGDGTGVSAAIAGADYEIPTNWAVKTAAYTAVAGDLVFANTTSGAFAISLPTTSIAIGDDVWVAGQGWETNSVSINPGGAEISGPGGTSTSTETFSDSAVILKFIVTQVMPSIKWRVAV